jgi:hypothetical protein
MYYFLLCLWAVCLFLALIGAGRQALRLSGFTEMSWPLCGVIGASVFIFAGGFLNLANLVHRPILFVMVVLGVLLFLVDLVAHKNRLAGSFSNFMRQPLYARGLGVVCAVVLIILVLGSLTYSRFSRFDDMPAYLTYPVKLIQLGSLPFDPFSERRVQSGLGASYFLQSFMLVAGDVRSMWFVDGGAGLVLFAGCIYGASRKLGNAVPVCLGLVWLVLLIPVSHVNLGMTVLPAAMFAAFFLIEAAEETPATSRSVLLGLLAAAVALLKSTYFPLAILILPFLHLLRLRKQTWARTLHDALISAFTFLAVLFPWMLDMKRKEGTPLYPLFGKGFEVGAYGAVPHFVSAGIYPVELGLAALIAFAAAAVAHGFAARKLSYADEVSMLALAGGLVILPISLAVGGSSLLRYIMPCELPFVLILLASLLRIPAKGKSAVVQLSIAYACAGALILTMEGYGISHSNFALHEHAFGFQPVAHEVGLYMLNDDVLVQERERASSLQNSIPPGQAVYANFLPTFAMNFQRNNIYVADFPGMSSLPPGMPIQGTPAELRSYLLSKSVRYVAYSTKLIALSDEALNWPRTRGGTWPRIQSLNAADVDHEVVALAKTCLVIYDDGDEKVIDLLQSR